MQICCERKIVLKKMALKVLLRKWKQGGFKVVFWDGEQEAYGD
ncbi:hypothetical protein KL86SPO_20404 [uncultured Sporomusa sp.]|uniref:Uncharacterized protein n=1 Tax=uncultured Sporomusa sp. TaxID=307249 RepID=A0A212LNK7_9FIRM|nr:hypothetical protein KL86SPO_20404 [uncultured Sporomusa sp.]